MLQTKAVPSHAPIIPTSSAPTLTTATPPGEVVGAGLPLMARLRLLKQREEAAAAKPSVPIKSPSPMLTSPDCSLSPPSSADVPSSRPWPLLVNKKSSESGESTKSVTSPQFKEEVVQAQVEEPPSHESPPTTLSPPIKSPIIVTTPPLPSPPSAISPTGFTSPPMTSPPPVFSPPLTISPPQVISPTSPPFLSSTYQVPYSTSPLQATSPTPSPFITSQMTSQPLSTSQPQVVLSTSPPLMSSPPQVTSPVLSSSGSERSPKPSLLSIRQDTKFYQSIDDLSPEYSGLPFVKKLKILNERQKLAALVENTATVRSSSLDSGNNSTSQAEMFPAIQRSRSEACDIDYVQRTRGIHMTSSEPDSSPGVDELEFLRCESPGTPPSPECNETLERRNLKSILKKLSSNNSEENKDKPASKIEFRRLLRAQTVEGYAARHSKFAKSVTFNRESLSPPPPLISENAPAATAQQTKNKMNFLLPSLLLPPLETRREEEFFGEVIAGMKTVLQNHMVSINLETRAF
jgi:hypothetical protein